MKQKMEKIHNALLSPLYGKASSDWRVEAVLEGLFIAISIETGLLYPNAHRSAVLVRFGC